MTLRWKRAGTELRCYQPTREKAAALFGCDISEVEPAGWFSALGNTVVSEDITTLLADNNPKPASHPDNRRN